MALVEKESGNSGGESDYKKFSAFVGVVGSVIAVLTGLNALTGFNPLKDLVNESTTTTPAPTTTPVRPWVPPLTVAPRPTWTPPPPPVLTTTAKPLWLQNTNFYATSTQWGGPCGLAGCSMSAIFRNIGGAGQATATFYIIPNDGNNQYVAQCSVVIPYTSYEGLTTAGCTAYNGGYQQYIRTHPGMTFRMNVQVQNSISVN